MFKKLILVLMMGAFLLSACGKSTPEITEVPVAEETATPTEESTTASGEGVMPCKTVYDYETTAETDYYQAIVDQLPPLSDEDWQRGNPDAEIIIFEYADFQCPACVGFAQYTAALLEYFPNSIKVVFRHLPLPSIHDKAYLSGMVAEAAGAQGKFWEMHDVLYQNQNAWSGLSEDDFIEWAVSQAESMGLDPEQFEEDALDKDKRAEFEQSADARLAMGMNYTPTVVVNGRIYRESLPNLFSLIGIYEYGGYEDCPPWVIDPDKAYTAVLDTSVGQIKIELLADLAPLAVNSFVFLSENGWFDEVYFHRVVEDFVAQAGDPSGFGVIGPGYTFANETENDLSFDSTGFLGMANAGVDTNGSQFFITLAPATELDGKYTIFGKVLEESLPVLEKIALRDPDTETDFENATMINTIEIIEQ